MASNMSAPNGNTEQPGDFTGSSEVILQVSGEWGVFLKWMLLQGINKKFWWHCLMSILQIGRVIMMRKISKLILVCGLMIIS